MLLKSCNRCGNLFEYNNESYCGKCLPGVIAEREARRQELKRANDRQYNKKREGRYSQFYNSKGWGALSARRLQDDGFRCAWCGGIADEVDHIVEIKTPEGWERRYDYDNTRSLCHSCHNKRHNRFITRRRTRR